MLTHLPLLVVAMNINLPRTFLRPRLVATWQQEEARLVCVDKQCGVLNAKELDCEDKARVQLQP